MTKKTQLFISNPCHQQWGDMRPDMEGRFCGSCQRTVVDFTMMNDQEILAWFAGARGPVCGRFINNQLNRDLVSARMPKKRVWAVLWQFLLAGLLVSSETLAREKPMRPPVGQTARRAGKGVMTSVEMRENKGLQTDTGRITFQVVDARTGEAVPSAIACIDKKHFQSDTAGRFSVSRVDMQKGRKIEVIAIGYEKLTWKIPKKMLLGNEQVIRLSMDISVLGDVILVGAVEER